MSSPDSAASDRNDADHSFLVWGAALLALAGVWGSIHLSVNRELKACPLCLYQRTFVMGTLAVLVTALFFRGVPRGFLAVLALPTAVAGLVIASIHVSLEARQVIECPRGLIGAGSAPQESLGLFVLLVGLLAGDAIRQRLVTRGICAIALGGLLGWGAFRSSPPPCGADYTRPVDQDGCRKVQPPTPPGGAKS